MLVEFSLGLTQFKLLVLWEPVSLRFPITPFPAIDNCLSSWRQFGKLLEMSAVLLSAVAATLKRHMATLMRSLGEHLCWRCWVLDFINCFPRKTVLTVRTPQGILNRTGIKCCSTLCELLLAYNWCFSSMYSQSHRFENSHKIKVISLHFSPQEVMLMTPCKAHPVLHTSVFLLFLEHFLLSDSVPLYCDSIWKEYIVNWQCRH